MKPVLNEVDVLVIGGGNAGFSSAIPPQSRAIVATVYYGLADVLPIVNNVDEATASIIDIEPYSAANFADDISRICVGRSDPDLSCALVNDSNAALKWLAGHGVRFQLSFNRQAYKIDGRFKFWDDMCLKTQDGGKGLIDDPRRAAKRLGVKVLFSTAAKCLVVDTATKAVRSVIVEDTTGERHILAGAVVLAAGGFEVNPRMRSQFLEPNWDFAEVRGTPYNICSCLEMAIRDVSAKQAGNWSGCHSVAWDANAPPNSGDRIISNEFTKSGYPLGALWIQGVDLRNYTYAIFGNAILAQPGHAAFQVWDAQMTPWLRDEEYRYSIVENITASTLEELADRCAECGLKDPSKFWDPAVKDGLSTQSSLKQLALPKSNWATPLTKGPYMAIKATCGVTFTLGGLAVDHQTAGVISSATNSAVPGLYCAG
ncbi:hypothetical protein N7509_012972 [Penicillium cosmopolitanum]|uniref:FAD-dependent oxidoreductase 2 FAD-binding domain-containing protein n=1 Tax=Penicillium cosmopolitanum TaxID=1131564 RepID=A0A9W9SCH4_9EURO|nr:uncharacterized protein N7509_012972 [Penicillium cosmopolitanum]KAJ5376086.1 hypothetical protein N7509_012972 [Penicillium cosmopolitanum]